MVHINDSCSYLLCHLPAIRARQGATASARDAAGSNGSALGLVTRPCHAGGARNSVYSRSAPRLRQQLQSESRLPTQSEASRSPPLPCDTAILALGIGTSVTMSSVLYAVALRPLPYERPNEFVRLDTRGEDWEIVNVAAK